MDDTAQENECIPRGRLAGQPGNEMLMWEKGEPVTSRDKAEDEAVIFT